ncbi:MAG: asparagine synthase (glutamine-hydrolyzing) [Candidatus Sumerlaeia bacterium]
MCGFTGMTHPDSECLRRMNARLAHRGPDDSGYFQDDHVGLAHCRLAILDLSEKGHQPMAFRHFTIAYNGEIYNFRELRGQLEERGYAFDSDCDTEVLLKAYAEWGSACLSRLNGMFAFAIYDSKKREIFLARDRLGIKPLYLARRGKAWLFASELKAIVPEIDHRSLDRRALVDYLTFRFVPDNATLIEGVERLEPGHCMRIDAASGEAARERWWRLEYGDNGRSLQENAEGVLDLLRQSVRRRLISDVPLGAYLSGGLDSSALVALMAETSERPVHTFTVSFGNDNLSEAAEGRFVAEHFGTDHQEIPVEMDAVSILPELIYHLDTPIGDAATIPVYLMARATKQHATVVLSGEGSDECFAGYYKYKPLLWGRKLPPMPRLFKRGWPGRINALLDANRARGYLAYAAVFNNSEMEGLLDFLPNWQERFSPDAFFTTGKVLHDYLNLDVHTWLPNDLLLKGDTMTMAHAVEARVPFLDHQLVEFAAAIPPEQKMDGRLDKIVFRHAARAILPERILQRKKQGFTIPLARWMDQGLGDFARDLFASVHIPELRTQALEPIVDEACRNVYTRRRFWTTLFLAAWYREVLLGKGGR